MPQQSTHNNNKNTLTHPLQRLGAGPRGVPARAFAGQHDPLAFAVPVHIANGPRQAARHFVLAQVLGVVQRPHFEMSRAVARGAVGARGRHGNGRDGGRVAAVDEDG